LTPVVDNTGNTVALAVLTLREPEDDAVGEPEGEAVGKPEGDAVREVVGGTI
jgi:hypothetical protein